jgi:hypothetical protein
MQFPNMWTGKGEQISCPLRLPYPSLSDLFGLHKEFTTLTLLKRRTSEAAVTFAQDDLGTCKTTAERGPQI